MWHSTGAQLRSSGCAARGTAPERNSGAQGAQLVAQLRSATPKLGRAARGTASERNSGTKGAQLVAQLRSATPELRARSSYHSSGPQLRSLGRVARGTAPERNSGAQGVLLVEQILELRSRGAPNDTTSYVEHFPQ